MIYASKSIDGEMAENLIMRSKLIYVTKTDSKIARIILQTYFCLKIVNLNFLQQLFAKVPELW